MKKSRSLLLTVIMGIGLISVGCTDQQLLNLLVYLFGGTPQETSSWLAGKNIELSSTGGQTMNIKDGLFGADPIAKGKAVSEDYTAHFYGTVMESSESLVYEGTVEEKTDGVIVVAKDEQKPANEITLDLDYDKASDTLSGDIDFSYEGTLYSGNADFSRYE
ncbi:MAG: hypothetical protein RBT72_05375 [Spirochaetia bacterium]|nr:hypothetical protein [Spirochaetia bacterium]